MIFNEFVFIILTMNVIVDCHAGEVICYYGSWAKNRPSNGKFTVEDIEPKYCTIIIYCCIGLNEDARIKPYDAESDLPKFISLKNSNPNVKLLTAIGGPNEHTEIYSKLVGSPEIQLKFAMAMVEFLKRHKLDGLDFMWENPDQNGGMPLDKENFVGLLQRLRNKFIGKNWLLTATVAATNYLIDSFYDVEKLSNVLDYINIKSLDYYSSSDPFIYVHSPLYAPKSDPNRSGLTQNGTVWRWLEAGADRAKIILGLAAYGRSFQLENQNNNELMASANGPGPAGPYSAEEGMLTYLEICEKMKKDFYQLHYYDEIQAVSAYKGLEWIGFDNIESIAEKSEYARSMRLGGVMLYWIDGDDKRSICGDTKFPLLEAIRSVYPMPDESAITTTTQSSGTVGSSDSHISKEEAKVMCISRKYGSSFANPLQSCTNQFYRCLRIMLGDFFARDFKCEDPMVFDEFTQKCKNRQYVDACNGSK